MLFRSEAQRTAESADTTVERTAERIARFVEFADSTAPFASADCTAGTGTSVIAEMSWRICIRTYCYLNQSTRFWSLK